MKIKSFYLLLLFLLLLFSCKKAPNSASQGNTNTPPQTKGTYLGDTTINYSTGLVPDSLAELLSVPVLDTSTLPKLERAGNTDRIIGEQSFKMFPRLKNSTDIDPAYDVNNNFPGMPPPGTQGKIGSCAAWAVGYGMMGYLYGTVGKYSDYNSPDRIFSPEFIYNQTNSGVDHGISLCKALKFVKYVGCCKWSDMPVDGSFTEQPSTTALEHGSLYKITAYYRINNIDINLIKGLIDGWKYPIVFAINIDNDFKYIWSSSWEVREGNRMVWKTYNKADAIGQHAMVIVGYDDAINAFKVQNSWLPTWGPNKDGYCWIDYDLFKNQVVTISDGNLDLPELFVGLLELPKLSTSTTTSITETTATSGGNITNNENNSIISRGICWSTVANPTTADNKIVDGATGIGVFASNISGLSAGTTYYVRAYAVTGVGTTYGNDVSFTTSATGGSDTTVTDIDGNVYHTVKIGTQTWMVENLRTTHYRNGDALAYILNGLDFVFSDTGAYTLLNSNIYGNLYNWYTTTDYRQICPEGWHIPSDAEWTTLTNFLGGESIAGDKMKATSSWVAPTTAATNESGFTGLPAGYLDGNNLGAFAGYGSNCYWWSSTIGYASDNPWVRGLINDSSGVFRGNAVKYNGFSIRCVKDD